MIGDAKTFARKLLRWYDRSRRDLPWRAARGRVAPVDPYHVLVSEAMLQQTQVATVVPYFNRFVERFASFEALARADEQDVLRMWQGLGYYSRARNLRKAARQVVGELGGALPRDVEGLRALPGVGRYTAGAVASIAFDCRAPIVDGNVARVLCRVDRIQSDPRQRATREVLWRRAEEVLPGRRCGDFNSALMELGATVCTPRSPQCLSCPVRDHCEAFAAGTQEKIPPPRKAKPTPLLKRWTFCMESEGKLLIEQRPATGRWAGMWQFVTTEANDATSPAKTIEALLSVRIDDLRELGVVTHALTHRRYEFEVFACQVAGEPARRDRRRTWASIQELNDYPLPRPHVKIAQMLMPVTPTGPARRVRAPRA
ncbi:MAG: A/G-specific adenine glycosylase [Tepidisphaeraceae bacterium]